jgi:hypothetical protein
MTSFARTPIHTEVDPEAYRGRRPRGILMGKHDEERRFAVEVTGALEDAPA